MGTKKSTPLWGVSSLPVYYKIHCLHYFGTLVLLCSSMFPVFSSIFAALSGKDLWDKVLFKEGEHSIIILPDTAGWEPCKMEILRSIRTKIDDAENGLGFQQHCCFLLLSK